MICTALKPYKKLNNNHINSNGEKATLFVGEASMAGINDQKAKVLPSSFSLIIIYSISAIFRCCTYHPDTVPVISRLAKNAFHVTRERGGMLDQPFRLGHVADS